MSPAWLKGKKRHRTINHPPVPNKNKIIHFPHTISFKCSFNSHSLSILFVPLFPFSFLYIIYSVSPISMLRISRLISLSYLRPLILLAHLPTSLSPCIRKEEHKKSRLCSYFSFLYNICLSYRSSDLAFFFHRLNRPHLSKQYANLDEYPIFYYRIVPTYPSAIDL